MAYVIRRPEWYLPERQVTAEKAFLDRRRFLQAMGLGGAALAIPGSVPLVSGAEGGGASGGPPKALYPARRNPDFDPGWRLTNEQVAGSYNNFYEFSFDKAMVKELVGRFEISPWSIEIGGLVEKPMKLDLDELLRWFPLEERVYRFRCVEAWAMIVPWTGFELRRLIEKVAPRPEARFVRFVTFHRPEQAPGFKQVPHYPWPYFEGLRLDEALHPLTLVATGIYGKPLPKQHGAPVRLVVPWKYGYKSIKSIVKIEFVKDQPSTFWETLAPDEYPFESNVNPRVPHPRWSQATERIIDTGDRVRTQLYNGYGNLVARLYDKA
ncbi:MAG TPA: protein-methionine-sulfoxide reductase catalytic subunit MsrP [Methylomirabilota bacterium]|nr:protein-methionine-sulfoxide reductase catalytic subunit MsrP [Methylomirabilota bacterium]